MGIEVVSVHFPKAGGSSLRDSLLAGFGGLGTLLMDYVDDPAHPCSSFSMDPDGCLRRARQTPLAPTIRAIHGHFHPSKYRHLDDATWITILRQPLENLISIYYFWKTQTEGHPLYQYVQDSRLSLLEVARIPSLRYLMSRTYFGGVDMSIFDFIGTHERYAEECAEIGQLIGIPIQEQRSNTNQYPGYREQKENVLADRKTMTKLANLLVEDLRFYDKVMSYSRGRRSA